MPKLFPISLEVEEVALGRVVRILNKTSGIAKINLNLTEAKKSKPNGVHRVATQSKFPEKAEEFVMQVLNTHGPMRSSEMKEHFLANGRASGSVASAVHHAFKQGLIEKDKESQKWGLTRKSKDHLRHKASKE